MKTIILSLVVLFATQVQADVKPIGTVVPYMCTETVRDVTPTMKLLTISEVCLASRVGEKGILLRVSYVQAYSKERIVEDFEVSNIQDVEPGSNNVYVDIRSSRNESFRLVGSKGSTGLLQSLEGTIRGNSFVAEKFEFMVTTAGF